MTFNYERTTYFQDTDAAGVVYFANILKICHEAYEASLILAGIDLKTFFRNSETAIPIVHTSADFLRPIFCGDRLLVQLIGQQLSHSEYEISYQIFTADVSSPNVMAKALTRHVCINPLLRKRKDLPVEIQQWLNITQSNQTDR